MSDDCQDDLDDDDDLAEEVGTDDLGDADADGDSASTEGDVPELSRKIRRRHTGIAQQHSPPCARCQAPAIQLQTSLRLNRHPRRARLLRPAGQHHLANHR